MKKILLTVITAAVLSAFCFAESPDVSELTGNWKTEAFLTETEDGMLIASEAPYAFPHRGISEIRILDSGFIVFQIGASEFRAFYEPQLLDYGNVHLTCTFKNGEQLVLKLVGINDGWKYLVRIPTDSALAEGFMQHAAADAAVDDMEKDAEDGGLSDAGAEKAPAERLFAGIIRKKQQR